MKIEGDVNPDLFMPWINKIVQDAVNTLDRPAVAVPTQFGFAAKPHQ
jgi:hypothetical protein